MKTKQNENQNSGLQNRPDEQLSGRHCTRSEINETAPTGLWRGVFFDGPQPDQDHEGEEIPVWVVYVGDDEAEPTGTVYHVYNFTRAQALAQRMAGDRRLELINEATTA